MVSGLDISTRKVKLLTHLKEDRLKVRRLGGVFLRLNCNGKAPFLIKPAATTPEEDF